MNRTNAVRTSILAILLGLLFVGHSVDVRGQEMNRAAVVVSYGEGQNYAQCVLFASEEISGYELLEASELDVLSESSGLGEAICLLGYDGESRGCNYPQQGCFCECQGQECYYWSYWQRENGTWTYSQTGSSNTTVRNGSVDGWVWSSGTINQSANRTPPEITFEEVCQVATATPTVTATEAQAATPTSTPTFTNTPQPDSPDDTPTPTPTVTHTPTAGPTPTVTNTPYAPPTIRLFTVDRTQISFGEGVTLSWDVADSTQVLLRYPGAEETVSAQGSRTVTPDKSTQYSLYATSPVGQAEASVTVEVNPVISAPTADPAAANEASQIAAVAPPQPAPTDTWTPSPVPTQTSLPTATEAPTETPTREAVVGAATMASAVEPPLQESPLLNTSQIQVAPGGAGDAGAGEITQAPTAPPVVILEPVTAGSAESMGSARTTNADQNMMVAGLAFLVGAPLLFGGVWLALWLTWKRTP